MKASTLHCWIRLTPFAIALLHKHWLLSNSSGQLALVCTKCAAGLANHQQQPRICCRMRGKRSVWVTSKGTCPLAWLLLTPWQLSCSCWWLLTCVGCCLGQDLDLVLRR
jgi:hypothetical protein